MRWTAPTGASLALAALLLVPAASACDIAFLSFAQPQVVGGEPWFVEGDHLTRVQGNIEQRAASGVFLSYAALPDGRLLVAGQQGLGADCSGEAWIELRDGDATVWREGDEASIHPHPLGPFVIGRGGDRGDGYRRLDGDRLVPHAERWGEADLIGWDRFGGPVHQWGRQVRVQDMLIDVEDGVAAAAWSPTGLAILTVTDTSAVLRIVDDGAGGDAPLVVQNVTWGLPSPGWGASLAWADGWHVVAGGHAYHVTAERVRDLGLGAAASVAADGARALVFNGGVAYVVFEAGEAKATWSRQDGTWSQQEALPMATTVPSVTGPRGPWAGAWAFEEDPPRPDDEDGIAEIPVLSTPLLATLLALAGIAARRRS